jgi:hypothetical protein
MRPFVDLLLEMTLLNDSWQKHRVVNILKGGFLKLNDRRWMGVHPSTGP